MINLSEHSTQGVWGGREREGGGEVCPQFLELLKLKGPMVIY